MWRIFYSINLLYAAVYLMAIGHTIAQQCYNMGMILTKRKIALESLSLNLAIETIVLHLL